MADEYTIGDLARQDIYPDETLMQPPPEIPASSGEEYAGLGGDPRALATGIKNWWTNQPSWMQKVGDVTARDTAAYQSGGAPAVIGQLADTSAEQDLLGGFGGNTKSVTGKVVPGALAALGDYHPPFYSAVEQAVAGAKQTTAPGQQWRGFLSNQPGVKPEELSTLKLGDLFDQTGAVTKQDLLDHIAANKVQLGEVVKGGERPTRWTVTSAGGPAAENQTMTFTTPEAARDEWARRNLDSPGAFHSVAELPTGESRTKFSQYTLPGGENYRETLLTLPTPNDNYIAAVDKLKAKYGDKPLGQMPMTDAERAYIDNQINAYGDTGGAFKSSHFDEPNILAHIRTNDRVIDGKKTLFVEEVQSDWHQKGKREGYGLQITPEAESLMPEIRKLGISEDPNNISSKMITDAGGDYNLATKWWNLVHDRQVVVSKGPPDAPFKTTWPDLAMKRVIREAAEKGYDKVAWTPGSVQADRYDLSKHVDYIDYVKEPNGNYRLGVVGKDGQGVNLPKETFTPNELSDYVGKDVADKIVNGEGQTGGGRTTLRGLDLKIGGEGMKGFYDEILPATVNKLVKKHGGRVGQSEINAGGKLLNETEAMPGRPVDVRRSERGGGYTIALDGSDTTWGLFNDEHAARARMSALQEAWDKAKTPVHTLDITPQLREMALKKGFPLFTAGGLVAGGAMGDLAKQDDYQ